MATVISQSCLPGLATVKHVQAVDNATLKPRIPPCKTPALLVGPKNRCTAFGGAPNMVHFASRMPIRTSGASSGDSGGDSSSSSGGSPQVGTSGGESGGGGTPMTPDAASRIQSAEAHKSGGGVSKGSFASRAQSAAAKNVSSGKVSGGGGKGGGGKGGTGKGGKR